MRITALLLLIGLRASTGFTVGGFWPLVTSRTTELCQIPRRQILEGAFGAAVVAGGASKANASPPSTTKVEPLADLPMVRLKLPKGGFGREYVCIKLKVGGQGPYDFMIDSGLTTELITPHLQESLGIAAGKDRIAGLAAGGGTAMNSIIDLDGASLCCGKFPNDGSTELPLPKLRAVVTDFPQEHIDPAHDPVEGMLGMELLSLFDVEFDFPNNRIRFWKPGTADKKGLVEIPAVVINETGLIGMRVNVPGVQQPVLGFLDCGATFSCMNWKAAAQFGFPPERDGSYRKGPSIAAVGIDGRMLTLSTIKQTVTFTGDVIVDPATKRPTGFVPPPPEWKPWDPVQVAIGDIPAFSSILGDGITPYSGPAVLIGLDVLAQRRLILETGRDGTRRRRVFVSPK